MEKEKRSVRTYSLINDTFNMSGSNLQFKAGVVTYLSEEAAIKGNLDLNHALCYMCHI